MAWLQWRIRSIKRMIRAGQPLRAVRHPEANARWILQKHGLAVMQEAQTEGAFVVYGTLLGLIREGQLLSHDDDIDFGVLPEHWDQVSAQSFPGFRREDPYDWEIRLTHKKTGIVVDFFRFQEEQDQLYSQAYSDAGLHRYQFPAALLRPLRPFTWQGRTWQIPAQPEAFLAAHYGPDWKTPRPNWDYRTDATSDKAKHGES